ncbi:MAG: tetratricopeptide repeat protein [Woeseiaceae bacterium]|nr:tetratricopeptide repeat protein [Woeseiaceae bacterium]NIP21341.1 tetratricopeptide repeat protein [Woeseiaceae bacterium]
MVALVFCVLAPSSVHAQQTVQVSTVAELRQVLGEAETLLATGSAQAAYALLQPLESEHSGNTFFDYLLGVAALDSGRIAEAVLSLQRAALSAPEFSGARMELARAHFEGGDLDEARPLFAALLSENPPPAVRAVIDQYLTAINATPGTPRSDFRPYAELMVGHDDNANGSTDNQQFLGFALTPENLATESSFFEGGAGFNWTVPRSARFAWHLGAHAGYRKNPDASFVDAGILSGIGGMIWQSGANFGRFSVDAYAASRDGESNESYTGANLLIGRRLNERWELSLALRGGALRYDEAIEVLDVDRLLYTVGLAYRFQARGQLALEAIGGEDSERQSGSPYGNSKSGARLSVNTAIGDNTYLFASVGSLRSDFDELFFGAPRKDTQLSSVVQIEFRDVMTDGLSIVPRLRYIDNESDVSLYDWDRTEVGLLIRWEPR